MSLLEHGVDASGFGLSQGALLPLCTSQVDGCARFVYQHGGTSLQELVDTNSLSPGERRALMPWVAATMVVTLVQLEEKVSRFPALLQHTSCPAVPQHSLLCPAVRRCALFANAWTPQSLPACHQPWVSQTQYSSTTPANPPTDLVSLPCCLLPTQCLVHRDLKLDNIVYDKSTSRVRLIDFGCAARYYTPTMCGTPGCWPHECFQLVGEVPGEEVPAIEEPGLATLSAHFTSTWDTWCLGLALLKLWGCCLPSHLGRYSFDAWRKWSAADWGALLAQQIPDHPLVRGLLLAMLQPELEHRCSASQLLEDPLIKDLVAKVGACC